MTKLVDYMWDWLYANGVTTVYYVAGGGAMHLVDSLNDSPMQAIACLHEQGAAIAACAHATYTGIPAVCLVTSGPGVTNALTGALAARWDSKPVIFISGQAKTADTYPPISGLFSQGSQHIKTISFVEKYVKWCGELTYPQGILGVLKVAWSYATTGRKGPVWISLPVDIQAKNIDEDEVDKFTRDKWPNVHPDTPILPVRQVLEVADALREASRPVIMLGYGCSDVGAVEELDRLLTMIPEVPVLLTWKALGLLPEDHPNYLGRPGTIGQRHANWTLQWADTVIFIGCRLDPDSIAFNPDDLCKYAKKIFWVDIDHSELLKYDHRPITRINADAQGFLHELNFRYSRLVENPLEEKKMAVRLRWLSYMKGLKMTYGHEPRPATPNTVELYEFIRRLSRLCEEGENIVFGSSAACANVPCQVWETKWGQTFVFEPGIGAMGFGVPELLGVGIASRGMSMNSKVILINGDGGFQLNIQELETIRREKIDAKIFYLNNDGYGSIRSMQSRNFGRFTGSNPGSGLTFPSVALVARTYGFHYRTIQNMENLDSKLYEILSAPYPVIAEVILPLDFEQMPRVLSQTSDTGDFIPGTLEEMWPFINPTELQSLREGALNIE